MHPSSLQELSATSLAEQAYEAIRSAITHGELAAGERITERGLAAMLAVSATPVREAIRRLEQEGLVERRASRELVVVVDESPDGELALIEAALKAVAVRIAATNATPGAVAAMERHLDEADRLRAELRHIVDGGGPYPDEIAERLLLSLRAFHAEVEHSCANPVLLRMLSTADAFSFRHRVTSLRDRVTSGQISDDRYLEHRRILDAIRRHDPDEAERVMAHHARVAALGLAAPTASPIEEATT